MAGSILAGMLSGGGGPSRARSRSRATNSSGSWNVTARPERTCSSRPLTAGPVASSGGHSRMMNVSTRWLIPGLREGWLRPDWCLPAAEPITHPDDALARTRQEGPTGPAVFYLHDERAALHGQPDFRSSTRTGVLEHIGEHLLDDAIGGHDARGQIGRNPVDGERHVHSGLPQLVGRRGRLGSTAMQERRSWRG